MSAALRPDADDAAELFRDLLAATLATGRGAADLRAGDLRGARPLVAGALLAAGEAERAGEVVTAGVVGDRLAAADELRGGDREFLADEAQRGTRLRVESILATIRRGAPRVETEPVAKESAPVFRSLSDLIADPDLLRPPPAVVAGLAWRGRVTLLAAREKFGKSTLVGHAAAALSAGGWWLGFRLEAGTVAVVDLEEALGDPVRRLLDAGADPARVVVADRLPAGVADLRALLAGREVDLVVLDSLAAYGAGRVAEWSQAAQVASLMAELIQVVRDFPRVALVVLHHAAKNGTGYRDSSAIGAAVDVIITMTAGDRPEERILTPVGRIAGLVPQVVRWTGNGYEIAGARSIEDRVLEHVASNPGCSGAAIRAAVGAGSHAADAAVRALIADHRVERRQGKHGSHCHYVAETVSRGRVGVAVGVTPTGDGAMSRAVVGVESGSQSGCRPTTTAPPYRGAGSRGGSRGHEEVVEDPANPLDEVAQ